MNYLFTMFVQNKSNFYLGVNWKEQFGDIEVVIFHEGEYYDGIVSVEDFHKLSAQAKIEMHEYWDQSQLIWNSHSLERKDLEVKRNDSDPSLVSFIWKKVLPNKPIKQRLGLINLKKSTNKGNNFLNFLVDDVNQHKQNIKKLNDELEKLTKNYDCSLKALQDLSDVKEKVEKNLFSKFVAVLNQKKEKIRSIKERLEEKESDSLSALENSQKRNMNEKLKISKKRKKFQSSPDDDDDDAERNYETDNEELKTLGQADRRSNSGSVSTADEMDASFKLEDENFLEARSRKIVEEMSDMESDRSDQLIIKNEYSLRKAHESEDDVEENTQELIESEEKLEENVGLKQIDDNKGEELGPTQELEDCQSHEFKMNKDSSSDNPFHYLDDLI